MLFLPIAFLLVIMTPNEYKSQGVAAISCDGPFLVLIFALPSLIVYGFGMFVFAESFIRTRNKWKYFFLFISLCCITLITLITPNTMFAFSEHNSLGHKEVCGDKW